MLINININSNISDFLIIFKQYEEHKINSSRLRYCNEDTKKKRSMLKLKEIRERSDFKTRCWHLYKEHMAKKHYDVTR